MPQKTYFIYIMASVSKTIYIGMTGDIERRVEEHRLDLKDGFTSLFQCHQLVYFEEFATPEEAIRREKQLKGYRRDKKVALIDGMNPEWEDLYERVFE
jgi:putative endonuclease